MTQIGPSPKNLGLALRGSISLEWSPKLMRDADDNHALHHINWRAETAIQTEKNL